MAGMTEKYKCSECGWVGDKEELGMDGFNCPACGGKVNVGWQGIPPVKARALGSLAYLGNLAYCNEDTKTYIDGILNSDSVSDMTKEIIRTGLQKDCVDAVAFVQLAADVLKAVRDDG